MMQRLLLSSRCLINIAVITTLFGSLAIIIDGVLTAINVIGQMFLRQELTVEA